jgi:hypothetical protein
MDGQPLLVAGAMADAMTAATQFGETLYPDNVVCVEDERVSDLFRFLLDDGDEPFPVQLAVGHTHMLISGRAVPVAPGTTQAATDAAVRACAPAYAVCDYCSGAVAPVAGLLPVPAGAQVAVLCLCEPCRAFLADTFPSAHFVSLED